MQMQPPSQEVSLLWSLLQEIGGIPILFLSHVLLWDATLATARQDAEEDGFKVQGRYGRGCIRGLAVAKSVQTPLPPGSKAIVSN